MTVLESLLVVPSVQGRCSNAGFQWPGSLPKAIPMQLRSLLTFCGALLCLFAVGCAPKNYGDDQYQLRMAAAGKDIMWVPSKLEIVHKMLDAAQVTSADVVYDLGSGDGIVPLEAARRHGARSVGIEYNPDLVALAQRNAKRADLERLVTFKQWLASEVRCAHSSSAPL